MDTNRVAISLIIITLFSFQNAASDEIRELVSERCQEAMMPESLATCDPDKGRIYIFDPQIKGFDEARRWCRQKLGGLKAADLISIVDCNELDAIPEVIKPFIKAKTDSGSNGWIWTQIISGPRITESSSLPEIVMERLSGDATESLVDLQSNCLKTITKPSDKPNGGSVLVLLVNELSITPQLIQRTLDAKGHALCEYRFTPGTIDIHTEAPSAPVTEPIPEITTQTRTIEITTSKYEDYENVDEFFDKYINITTDEESSQNVAKSILEIVQEDNFVLTTPDHIEKTVGLVKKLDVKIDEELSQLSDKELITAKRVSLTQQVCSILSTLMETKNEQCWENTDTEKTPVYATQIISTTENVGLKLACELNKQTSIPIDANSIQMEVFSFENQSYYNQEVAFPSQQLTTSQTAQIKFPSGFDIETIALASACGRASGLGTIIKKVSTYMDPPEEKVNIISDLVSFSFGERVNNLDVEVSLSHNSLRRRGDLVQCVFWDQEKTVWNSSGCVYDAISSTRRKTVCHCTHLTNFAILMDISGRQEDDQVKSVLTLIVLTASVISLILTIFFLITLPPVKSTPITNKRITITTNLCICLLITDFLLMFGVEHTENIIWCRVISATLFYFLAATFTWMLLEGYLLYQMIVVVPLNFEFRSRWLYLLGYGLSLIWLGVTIGVLGFECFYDDTSYYCWISNPLYPSRIWFFVGPVALIILSNMIIYGKSIQIALMSNLKKKSWAARGNRPDQKVGQDNGLVRRWLKGSCSLLILLGITWIIGFLYFHEWSQWISYLFIIINGSQGIFIFLFEIVTNSKARPAIIKMVSGKFPSTYISSLSKTSSSNPTSSSTKSSKFFNQQSSHGRESSTTSPRSPTSLSERKKGYEEKPVVMELR